MNLFVCLEKLVSVELKVNRFPQAFQENRLNTGKVLSSTSHFHLISFNILNEYYEFRSHICMLENDVVFDGQAVLRDHRR